MESDNSNNVLSPTQEKLAANRTIAQASKSNDDTQESHQTLDDVSALSDSELRRACHCSSGKGEV